MKSRGAGAGEVRFRSCGRLDIVWEGDRFCACGDEVLPREWDVDEVRD
ncbi:hypothetical protein [Streptomyces sp. NPDC047043]